MLAAGGSFLLLAVALAWSMAAFPPVARGRQAVTWLVWLVAGVALCRIWLH